MGISKGHKAIISMDGVEMGEVESIGINLIGNSIENRDARENLFMSKFKGSVSVTPRITRKVGNLVVTSDKYKEIPKQYF